MVALRLLLLLLCTFVLPAYTEGAVSRVYAEIDAARLSEHRRLEGTINVLHSPEQKVDESSFRMEKRPLTVEFVKIDKPPKEYLEADPELGGDTLMDVFRFQLPGKPKGLYILPSITVKVDGKRQRSIASTYEVTESQASSALELEAIVDGEPPFYPGQRTTVRYRIFYNRSVELTEEHLPLLEAEGFQKVGDKEISDYQTDVYTVQEITQEVRLDEPGVFTFGPSYIEGVAYDEDILGKRVYDKHRMRAVAPAVHIAVSAFPDEEQPQAFTGAVGQYSMKGRLLTPSEIQIGDKIEVAVKIAGTGDLDSIVMPDVSCQPGFSGFFQMGEYPPFEQRDGVTREFIIAMRPLSAHVTEVPRMEFAYFDPHGRQYRRVYTEPIAVAVHELSSYTAEPRAGKEEEVPKKYSPVADLEPHHQFISGVDWRVWLGKPDDIKIESVRPLVAADLQRPRADIYWLWMSLAAAFVLLLSQVIWRRLRAPSRSVVQALGSEDYLNLAAQNRRDPAKMSQFLEKALVLLLQERGLFSGRVASPELLPVDGPAGEVREFLCDMHNKRFSGGSDFVAKQVLSQARTLYRHIRYGRG